LCRTPTGWKCSPSAAEGGTIILTARTCVVAAFVLASVLVDQTNVPNAVIASFFLARIAGGLAMRLGCEVVGRGHS
jgi:hypothetical protein